MNAPRKRYVVHIGVGDMPAEQAANRVKEVKDIFESRGFFTPSYDENIIVCYLGVYGTYEVRVEKVD